MEILDILKIASLTASLVGALLYGLWVWFSHKSRGPLNILEEKLRTTMHTEVGRIEKRAIERHNIVCGKIDRLDAEIKDNEDEIKVIKMIATRADGKADMALRDLDKRNMR